MKRRYILSFSVVTVLGLVLVATWARPDVISDYVVLAASAGPPGVDIHKTCRESERAITAIFGNSNAATFENCMRQEHTDQAQIVRDWASYPAADKTHCVQPKVYMPSYIEWLTCLEIARDVRRCEQKMPLLRPRPDAPATAHVRDLALPFPVHATPALAGSQPRLRDKSLQPCTAGRNRR